MFWENEPVFNREKELENQLRIISKLYFKCLGAIGSVNDEKGKELISDNDKLKIHCSTLREKVAEIKNQITEDVPDLTVSECETLTVLVRMEEYLTRVEGMIELTTGSSFEQKVISQLEDYFLLIYQIADIDEDVNDELASQAKVFFTTCFGILASQLKNLSYVYANEVKPVLQQYLTEKKLDEIKVVCRRIQLSERIYKVLSDNTTKISEPCELNFDLGKIEPYQEAIKY